MKAFIITPYLDASILSAVTIRKEDCIIAADTGFARALEENLVPDIIIGDFDHGKTPDFPENAKIVRVPCEKDDTDTMLCVKYAIKEGFSEIVIVGGIGGRMDHTVANIQTLAYAQNQGVQCSITDGKNEAFITGHDFVMKNRNSFYLSLFAYGGPVDKLTIRGTKYEAVDIVLDENFPLGVSNEITGEVASVTFKSGRLLVILSRKDN